MPQWLETLSELTVTSTSEDIPQHAPGTPHRTGLAADVRYTKTLADKTICCATNCNFSFVLDEAEHPSAHATAPHFHLQLKPGRSGGNGDLLDTQAKLDCNLGTCIAEPRPLFDAGPVSSPVPESPWSP